MVTRMNFYHYLVETLSGSIFVATFSRTQDYFDLTVEATARAIRAKARGEYRVTVFMRL